MGRGSERMASTWVQQTGGGPAFPIGLTAGLRPYSVVNCARSDTSRGVELVPAEHTSGRPGSSSRAVRFNPVAQISPEQVTKLMDLGAEHLIEVPSSGR